MKKENKKMRVMWSDEAFKVMTSEEFFEVFKKLAGYKLTEARREMIDDRFDKINILFFEKL